MSPLVLIATGLGAGILAGIFGIGGGILIVPALIYIGKMSPLSASGTSLAALVLPVGIFGAYAYYRNGHVDLRAAAWVAVTMFIGVYLGARIAQLLDADQLKRAFAVFLVIVAARMWFSV